VYSRPTRTLAYSGGGHPPPLLIAGSGGGNGSGIQKLDGPGPPVGISPDEPFPTLRVEVAPGSSLLIYSDGCIEIFTAPRKLWGIDGLVQFAREHDMTRGAALDALQSVVNATSGGESLADDFSTVLARFPGPPG
jgi:sigma-B regulation protein RsbU (phosphoserine phosphatase)